MQVHIERTVFTHMLFQFFNERRRFDNGPGQRLAAGIVRILRFLRTDIPVFLEQLHQRPQQIGDTVIYLAVFVHKHIMVLHTQLSQRLIDIGLHLRVIIPVAGFHKLGAQLFPASGKHRLFPKHCCQPHLRIPL